MRVDVSVRRTCHECEMELHLFVRQLMVMDETHVVNQMKEDTCYVTSDFHADVETARFSFI